MKKNVLVIGGTGYIGQEVVLRLLKSDLYNPISFSHHKNSNCISYNGDINNIEELEEIYKENEISATIILSGLSSIEKSENVSFYAKNDINGFINILNTCLKFNCKKVVYTSSSAIYSNGTSLNENSQLEINSFYSYIKNENEKLLYWYKKNYGLQYVILRCFNVCGCPTSKNFVSRDLITLIVQNKKINVFGTDFDTPDGSLIRDYVHVFDVANAIIKAIEYNSSDIFNIGTGVGYSVFEIIKKIEKKINCTVKIDKTQRRYFDQDCLISDSSKAKELLKWQPVYDLDGIIESIYEKIN